MKRARGGGRSDQLTRRQFIASSAVLLAGRGALAQPSAAPFDIIGLNHISLGVSNLQRALDFYQRLFDLTVYTRQGNGTLPIMTIGSGPEFVALAEIPADQRAAAGVGHHFSVHMEDFDPDRVLQTLATVGVPDAYVNMRPASAQRPPGEPSQDTPELLFRDPDGILLQIQDVGYCGGIGPLGDRCEISPAGAPTRAAPFRVRTLNHVSVGVSNVERSLEYYQRVFGYPLRTSQSRGTRPVLTIGSGPEFVMLREGSSDGHHFCLGIDPFDPDDVMATLEEHGVRGRLRMRPAADQRPVIPGAADTPEITIKDPDGHVVQIQHVSYCGGVGPLGNVCG